VTNEQLKEAIAIEATRRWKERGVHFIETLANIAVELTQEGWTPPVAVDPDVAEAREIVARLYDVSWPERANAIRKGDQDHNVENVSAIAGIKRGRALAAAEAKPKGPQTAALQAGSAGYRDWHDITHHAIITPPEDK